ncbi:hypothetical protein ACSSS7_008225 [Eimeria intestinalis]
MAALQIAGAPPSSDEICSGLLMQIYDARNAIKPWRSLRLRGRQKTCIACGDNPTIKAVQARPEYADICWYPTVPSARQMGGPLFAARLGALGPLWQQPALSLGALLLRQSLAAAATAAAKATAKTTATADATAAAAAAAAAEMLLIVDVRPATQFAVAHLPYSLHWPLESLLSYTAKREQAAAAAAGAAAAATAAAAQHEEACAFLNELLGCLYTPKTPKPQTISVVFVCRRGRDSAIATEALHALLASSATVAPSPGAPSSGGPSLMGVSSGGMGAPQHGGAPNLGGPLKVYNLEGGLEGLVRQGLVRMPVP